MSEGLQFVLDFAPDTSKVRAALADVAKVASEPIKIGAHAAGLGAGAVVGGWRGISAGLNAAGSQNPLGLGFTAAEAGIGKMSQMLSMIPEVGPALGAVTSQLAVVPGELHAITDSLISFSAVASPGQYRAYQMALEDLQGTIGQTFLPVLGLMRDGVRLTADVLATMLPSSGEAEQALSEFRTIFDTFSADVRQAVGAVGPQLRGEFVNMLKTIAEAIKTNMPSGKQVAEFVSGLVKLTSWLVTATKWLAQAFNATGGSPLLRFIAWLGSGGTSGTPIGEPGARTSWGAAARPAQISSAEAYQQQLQIAAYSQQGVTASQVPSMVSQIRDDVAYFRSEGIATRSIGSIAVTEGGAVAGMEAARRWYGPSSGYPLAASTGRP